MFGQPDRVDAKAVSKLRFRQRFADHAAVVFGLLRRGKNKVAEFHGHAEFTSYLIGLSKSPPRRAPSENIAYKTASAQLAMALVMISAPTFIRRLPVSLQDVSVFVYGSRSSEASFANV